MAHDQILSLCSGIGGLDLGLAAGLRAVGRSPRTVCLVEREAFTGAVLAKKMREGRLDECPLWLGDLRDLPLDELPEIDWITGGYPCQPWSAAGKRLGEADPRHLWPVILDIIRTVRPRGVFFENVGGHLSLGLDRVLQDLEGCGFRSAFGLFTAEEVGAPHRRERVFILGMADGDGDPRDPGESRRTAREVQGEGSRLRGGESEGEAGEEPRRRGPALADGDGRRLKGIGELYGESDEDRPPFRDDAHRRDSDLADADESRLERHSGNEQGERRQSERTRGHASEKGPRPTTRPRGGSELADAPDADRRIRIGGEEEGTREDSERRGRSPVGGPELADADGGGGGENIMLAKLRPTGSIESSGNCGRFEPGETTEDPIWNGWPSRPAEPQAEWEPRRTIERDLGRNRDGLPDRVDRLRALGNAVVPAQAATAFVTLWEEVTRC